MGSGGGRGAGCIVLRRHRACWVRSVGQAGAGGFEQAGDKIDQFGRARVAVSSTVARKCGDERRALPDADDGYHGVRVFGCDDGRSRYGCSPVDLGQHRGQDPRLCPGESQNVLANLYYGGEDEAFSGPGGVLGL